MTYKKSETDLNQVSIQSTISVSAKLFLVS